MKKSLWIALAAAALLISGCSQKEPEVDMTKQSATASEQQAANADEGLNTIKGSTESSGLSGEESTEQRIKTIEAKAKKIYFDFDKYNIRPDQQPRVDYNAELFQSPDAKDLTIKVEGNCDEWGSDEYNYALGLKRAKSVSNALAMKGVDKSRMVLISYGKSNPVCTEHTPACWAKNRRVEFELLP